MPPRQSAKSNASRSPNLILKRNARDFPRPMAAWNLIKPRCHMQTMGEPSPEACHPRDAENGMEKKPDMPVMKDRARRPLGYPLIGNPAWGNLLWVALLALGLACGRSNTWADGST